MECHRGNWSPSTPDLSDGIRRQHLVIASFGISSLPFSLRPFVIIFYNRMSNLPLAECRECLSGLVTHTHWLSFSVSADAFPQVCRLQLGPCITVIYLLSRLFDLLYCLCLFPPLFLFGCQVKSCVGEMHAFQQKPLQKSHSQESAAF